MEPKGQQEVIGVIAFVAAIWGVFLLQCVLPFDLTAFGVTPRTWSGLLGVPAMPFLHASFRHLASNTVPLFVLLTLLAGSRAKSWAIVVDVILLGGILLWVCGRAANHVGASGLIFGLIAFLIISGFLERRFLSLGISLIVSIVYGGSLMFGIIPRIGSTVSWEGHLCGAVAGGIIAFYLTRDARIREATSVKE